MKKVDWHEKWKRLKKTINQNLEKSYTNEENDEFLKGMKFAFKNILLSMEKAENE